MRRAVNTVLVLLLVTIVVAGALLYAYRAELVWLVVKNDTVYKAPYGYPVERIESVFQQERTRMEQGSLGKEDLLDRLFDLSQRLEKTQHLSAEELDRLLDSFQRRPPPVAPPADNPRRGTIPPGPRGATPNPVTK